MVAEGGVITGVLTPGQFTGDFANYNQRLARDKMSVPSLKTADDR
jgi:hypothetical protein